MKWKTFLTTFKTLCLTKTVKIFASLYGLSFFYHDKRTAEFSNLIANKQGFIFCFWHRHLFATTFIHQELRPYIILVSESKDGELIANVLDAIGHKTVRGSSTRGGVKAFKELYRLGKIPGSKFAITVDGPKGPLYEVKDGAVDLAFRLQLPLVPIKVCPKYFWTFAKSWDRFILPKPATSLEINYGHILHPQDYPNATELKDQLKSQLDFLERTF
jgi:lysophospholipid acyltransferase (LPLAT)-like uncharacterized protein